MQVSGLQKTTLLDYPGKVACTVFTPGCNFRCPFCYNRSIVLEEGNNASFSEGSVFSFLKGRRDVLDAVVICGGEPTLQSDLVDFIRKVRRLEFAVKLDTNGSRPGVLEKLIKQELVQFVSLDIKNALEKEHYSRACGLDNFDNFKGIPAVRESMNLLLNYNMDFELRTTVVPTIHDLPVLVKLAGQLRREVEKSAVPLGSVKWVLQSFEPRSCVDSDFDKVKPFSKEEMKEILCAVKQEFGNAQLRGSF